MELTKGFITKVATGDSNIYRVRIPLFEQAGIDVTAVNNSEFDATLCYTPGIVGGLELGDAVWVSFENNSYNNPVIIGKLYLAKDKLDPRASVFGKSLSISENAILPTTTTIGGIDFSKIINVVKEGVNLADKLDIIDKAKQDKLIAGANIILTKKPNGVEIAAVGGGGGGGDGDVSGPDSSIDADIPVFYGVTGKIIQDSGFKLTDFLKLSGGTMSGHLIINGGDTKAIQLSSAADNYGRINDSATATLLGLNGASGQAASELLIGHSNYKLSLRGSQSRPTYNASNIALATDIIQVTANPTGTAQAALTAIKIGSVTYSIEAGAVDVINDLTHSDTDKALSAAMGKKLNTEKFAAAGGKLTGAINFNDKLTLNQVTNSNKSYLEAALANGDARFKFGWIDTNTLGFSATSDSNKKISLGTSSQKFYNAYIENIISDGVNSFTVADIATKISRLTTNVLQAYVHNANGTDSGMQITADKIGSTLAQRSASGTLKVATPTESFDATPKTYVDTLVGTESSERERVTALKLNRQGDSMGGTLNVEDLVPRSANEYKAGTSSKPFAEVFTQKLSKSDGTSTYTGVLPNKSGTIAYTDDILEGAGSRIYFNQAKVSRRDLVNYNLRDYFHLVTAPMAVFYIRESNFDIDEAISEHKLKVVVQRKSRGRWLTPASKYIGYGSNYLAAYTDSPYHDNIKLPKDGQDVDGLIPVKDDLNLANNIWAAIAPWTSSEQFKKLVIDLPYLVYSLTIYSKDKNISIVQRDNNLTNLFKITFRSERDKQFVGHGNRCGAYKTGHHMDKIFLRFYLEYDGERISDFTPVVGIWRKYTREIFCTIMP